jgi:MoxR-like ATPase
MINFSLTNNCNLVDFFQPIQLIKNNFYHYIYPYHTTSVELESLMGRITVDAKYQLQESEIQLVKKSLNQMNTFLGHALKEQVAKIPVECVTQILDEDTMGLFEKYLDLLPTASLLKMCDWEESQSKDIISIEAKLKEVALKNVLAVKAKAFWNQILPEIISFGHHMLAILIAVLGIDEIGGEHDSRHYISNKISSYEAQATLTTYLQILAYPATIFACVLAVVEFVVPAALITAAIVITSISLLIIYNKYFRPCPRVCDGLENLNTRMRELEADPILPRKHILDKIEKSFESGKAVLLVGGSGTGKTSIVHSLVERILAHQSTPTLNGTEVYQANTANISPSHDGVSLEHISRKFSNFTKNVVLFFDEIHAALKPNDYKTNEDSLLTFCDRFPFIIGATTTEQYEKYIKGHTPFERRFTIIRVEPLDQHDMEAALFDRLNQKNPELIFEEGVIPYICEKAALANPHTSRIDSATSLLAQAVSAASRPTFEQEEAEVESLSKNIRRIELQLQYENKSEYVENSNIYQTLLKRQAEVNQDLKQKKLALKKIQQIETLYLKAKKESYVISAQCDPINPFYYNKWLQNQAKMKVLMEMIEVKRSRLGLSGRLDKKLIDSIISSREISSGQTVNSAQKEALA